MSDKIAGAAVADGSSTAETLDKEAAMVASMLWEEAHTNAREGGSGRLEAIVDIETWVLSDVEDLKERVLTDMKTLFGEGFTITLQHLDTRGRNRSVLNINAGHYWLMMWVLPRN